MRPLTRLVTGVALCAVAGATVLGTAAADTVPVTVSVGSGTRTLHLSDSSGATLDSTHGLTAGPGHAAGFVTTVTDSTYSPSKFQVSATMSNLYPYSGSTYDFSSGSIPSSDVALQVPSKALDLANITALTQPVIALSGNLSSVLGLVTGLLGAGVDPSNVTTNVTAVLQSTTVQATDVLNGALASLPLNLSSGSGGAFTTPASLGAGDPVQGGTPTSLAVMNGNPNANPTGLLATVQGALGGKTATQLIGLGVLDQSSVLSALSSTLGLPLSVLNNPLLVNLTNLLGSLTSSVTSLGGILGQGGTYSSSTSLGLTVPSNTPAGTYRGVMTLTLADLP